MQILSAYPFLTVWVGQIVYSFWIPLFTDAKQIHWQETILSHNNEVDEETGRSLNHTNLTVGHGNESDLIFFVVVRERKLIKKILGDDCQFGNNMLKKYLCVNIFASMKFFLRIIFFLFSGKISPTQNYFILIFSVWFGPKFNSGILLVDYKKLFISKSDLRQNLYMAT